MDLSTCCGILIPSVVLIHDRLQILIVFYYQKEVSKFSYVINSNGRDDQDGRGVGHGAHLLHSYIKNSSTRGTICTSTERWQKMWDFQKGEKTAA